MDNRFMLRVGLEVRTSDGKRLGKVKQVGSGTFEVEKGFFFKRDLSMSFEDLARVDEDMAVLDLSADDLARIRTHGAIGTTFKERATGAMENAVHALDEAVHTGPVTANQAAKRHLS